MRDYFLNATVEIHTVDIIMVDVFPSKSLSSVFSWNLSYHSVQDEPCGHHVKGFGDWVPRQKIYVVYILIVKCNTMFVSYCWLDLLITIFLNMLHWEFDFIWRFTSHLRQDYGWNRVERPKYRIVTKITSLVHRGWDILGCETGGQKPLQNFVVIRQSPRSIVDRTCLISKNAKSYGCDASPLPPPSPSPPFLLSQPENAIRVKKFSLEDDSDPTQDTILYDLAPFLTALATQVSWNCIMKYPILIGNE